MLGLQVAIEAMQTISTYQGRRYAERRIAARNLRTEIDTLLIVLQSVSVSNIRDHSRNPIPRLLHSFRTYIMRLGEASCPVPLHK